MGFTSDSRHRTPVLEINGSKIGCCNSGVMVPTIHVGNVEKVIGCDRL
jgi:hypothetical protein